MGDRLTYVRPSWFERHIIAAIPRAARLMSRLTGDAVLQVRGRHSGHMRTTLARPITVGQSRYLVAIRGETQWARNLRAVGQASLQEKGRTTQIRAIEAHDAEKRAVIEAFIASSKYAPTRRLMSETLPDADQHPVFRIEATS